MATAATTTTAAAAAVGSAADMSHMFYLVVALELVLALALAAGLWGLLRLLAAAGGSRSRCPALLAVGVAGAVLACFFGVLPNSIDHKLNRVGAAQHQTASREASGTRSPHSHRGTSCGSVCVCARVVLTSSLILWNTRAACVAVRGRSAQRLAVVAARPAGAQRARPRRRAAHAGRQRGAAGLHDRVVGAGRHQLPLESAPIAADRLGDAAGCWFGTSVRASERMSLPANMPSSDADGR